MAELAKCLSDKRRILRAADVNDRLLRNDLQKCERDRKRPAAPRKGGPSPREADRRALRALLERSEPRPPLSAGADLAAVLERLPAVVAAVTSPRARRETPDLVRRVDAAVAKARRGDQAALRWATLRTLAAVLRVK